MSLTYFLAGCGFGTMSLRGGFPRTPPKRQDAVLDPFLFDTRGYDVVRSAIEPAAVAVANAVIDDLDVWARLRDQIGGAAPGVWGRTEDDVAGFLCVIGPGHIQVGPVTEWRSGLSDLVCHASVTSVLTLLFPEGYYVDHVSLSLAQAGAPGIGLHGGGYERDLRQAYRFHGGTWDTGLSIVMISLVVSPAREGGTALVPGSHKANLAPKGALPSPEEFAASDWVTGMSLNAGDILVFPEALMHGAFPWRSAWERRTLIIKAYPAHIANLNSRRRPPGEPFWRGA